MPPVVLFDGVCNLCNATVDFAIRRDARGELRFASLQSDAGQAVLEAAGAAPVGGGLETIVLVEEDGSVHVRSEAALRLAARLGSPWPCLARLARIVPRGLRDVAYRAIARRRYRWFGMRETCRLPTPEERARFL